MADKLASFDVDDTSDGDSVNTDSTYHWEGPRDEDFDHEIESEQNHKRSSVTKALFRRNNKNKIENGQKISKKTRKKRNRASISRMKQLVSPITLTYKAVLSLDPRTRNGNNRRARVLKQGHQERIERKKSRHVTQVPLSARRKRAQTLRKQWFEENRKKLNDDEFFLKSLDEILQEQIAFTKSGSIDGSQTENSSDTGAEAFEIGIVDLPDGINEEVYNENVDKMLKDDFKHMDANVNDTGSERSSLTPTVADSIFPWGASNKVVLTPAEKRSLKANGIRIKELRNALLAEQSEYVSQVRKQSVALAKGLEKHIKLLSATLKRKLNEYSEAEQEHYGLQTKLQKQKSAKLRAEDGEGSATVDDSTVGMLTRWFWSSNNEADEDDDDDDPQLEGDKNITKRLQEEKEKILREIRSISEELELAKNEKWSVEIERFFPKRMQWKLRINAGDGSCLGFQDLDFDSIVGQATLRMGEEQGVISLNIRDISAKIGISNFSIKGATVKSQLSKMFLTPTVNRLDLNLSGDWTLVLKFEPASEENNYQAKWVEDKQRSTLEKLHLNREISGLSALRLPKKIIEYLATSLIPSAINESVKNSFSPSLGNSLFEASHNKIVLEGVIKIEQEISSNIWRAPFVGNIESSKTARERLHLSGEEATWLDLLLRGKLAGEAGFHKKAASLYRLHKWRLQLAAHPVSRLKEICHLIQKDTSVYGFGLSAEETKRRASSVSSARLDSVDGEHTASIPDDWLLQIIDSVEDLAVKNVRCKLELYQIDFDLDMQNVVRFFADNHLIGLEEQSMKAGSAHAKHAAIERKKATERRIKEASSWFSSSVLPLLSRDYQANINGYFQGGLDAGSVALTLEKFSGGIFLNKFSQDYLLGWSPSKLSGWNLNVKGDPKKSNDKETAYSIRLKHDFMDREDELYNRGEEEEDARITIKDVDLKLFPKGYDPGAVELRGEQLQAWVSLAALSEFLVYWFVYPDKEQQKKHDGFLRSRNRTLQAKSSLLSLFTGTENGQDDGVNRPVTEVLELSQQKINKIRRQLNTARHMIVDDLAEEESDKASAEKEKKLAKQLRKRRNSVGRKQILSPEKTTVAAVAHGNVESIRKDRLAHPYVPRLLLDNMHDFYCIVNDLVVKASKVEAGNEATGGSVLTSHTNIRNKDGEKTETISLTLERASKYAKSPFFTTFMHWNIHDMFDDVEKKAEFGI